MAINLEKVSFKQIKTLNKKISAEFKEFYALLDFQNFIFENNQMRLKGFDYAVDAPFHPAPRLQKADFDFLIENESKKLVAVFVNEFISQKGGFAHCVKSVLCAKDFNITRIQFQNELEFAYFCFLLQIIAFCDYDNLRKMFEGENFENSKMPNLNNFIFEFICRSFVFQKCPVLNSIEFEKALAFERGNMYRIALQKQEANEIAQKFLQDFMPKQN